MREAQKNAKGKKCEPGCTCNRHKAYYRGGSKKGRKFSEQARQNIAEGARNRIYTDDDLERLAALLAGQRQDKDWEAARILALQEALTGIFCPEDCSCERHSEETRRKVSAARAGVPLSEGHRAKIRATLRQMILDGTWAPGITQPALYSRGATHIMMRSPWEVDFAETLDRHGIRWDFEPNRFDLGWTTYLPDFYLPESGTYIEVKGWLREDAAAKLASFHQQGHRVVLVTYHPSVRGLVGSVPDGVRVVLGPEVLPFVAELQDPCALAPQPPE